MLVATLPVVLDPALHDMDPQRWLFNSGPLLLFWGMLALLSARPLLAALLTGGLAALFYLAHGLKLAQLALPLLPADLAMARHLLDSPDLYLRYLGGWVSWALMGFLALTALLAVKEPPAYTLRPAYRVVLATATAGFIIALCSPWASAWSPYRKQAAPIWTPAEAAQQLGALALFLNLLPNDSAGLPQPDPRVVHAFRQAHRDALETLAAAPLPDPLPDLVVVQSESFFDPRRLNGMASTPLLEHFDDLATRAQHGVLAVPTFGGLTTRTEFEFLTGLPLRQLPQVAYPFQGLIRQPTGSVAWSLAQVGYETIAVHPFHPHFYQRDRVYPRLGFAAFHDESAFVRAERDGYYVSDRALTRHLIGLLERAGPQFVFAVTMENHGPWGDEDRGPPDPDLEHLLPRELEAPADRRALQRYLHHLRNADRALGELAAWVLQRHEPTLLLFYGDHLPALAGTYTALGFTDGAPADRQPTVWMLLDNRNPKPATRALGSHQLAALLLSQAGLHHDPRLNALQVALAAQPEDTDLHGALAADFLAHPPADRPMNPTEARLVTVEDWGPSELEAVYPAADRTPAVWVKTQEALPAGVTLALEDRKLPILHRTSRDLVARIPFSRIGEAGQSLRLLLIGPLGQRFQTLGSVRIVQPLPRIKDDVGVASAFCRVEDWGPRDSSRSKPANPQPGGALGVWLRAACLPPRVRITVDDQPQSTVVAGRLATTAVDPSAWHGQDRIGIGLLDPDSGQRLAVGEILIRPD